MTDRTYPYYLVRTANHGGGVVSRHWTCQGATLAMAKWRDRTKFLHDKPCDCPCVTVVAAVDYQYLYRASESPSPYIAARKG